MAFNGTGSNVTSLNASNVASGTLAVARGGTGTASPSLVGGTNITISGSWPNQTVTASGGGVTSLNGQTGAITSTNVDSIGSYQSVVYGISASSSPPSQTTVVSTNSTLAGSNLRYNYSGAQYIGSEYQNDGGTGYVYNGGGTALSGTWRAMSPVLINKGARDPCTGYTRTFWFPGLFVRIS
jgi:hypothetical protein